MSKELFVRAEEVAGVLGISKPYAYKLVREMNEELKKKGFLTITKTLQNGSRQLRTDRNLLKNSTDRPKDKVCVTGSDSFRKMVNRTLSRSRERNPKTGKDNHDIGNQHRRATCLAVLHIYQSIRKHPARFLRLAGCSYTYKRFP